MPDKMSDEREKLPDDNKEVKITLGEVRELRFNVMTLKSDRDRLKATIEHIEKVNGEHVFLIRTLKAENAEKGNQIARLEVVVKDKRQSIATLEAEVERLTKEVNLWRKAHKQTLIDEGLTPLPDQPKPSDTPVELPIEQRGCPIFSTCEGDCNVCTDRPKPSEDKPITVVIEKPEIHIKNPDGSEWKGFKNPSGTGKADKPEGKEG